MMMKTLESKEYEKYIENVNKFEEMSKNPKYEKSNDLFHISLRSLKKIAHIGSNDAKSNDQLIGGVFQTTKYSMGKNLLNTKQDKQVFGISSLREEVQNEIREKLRSIFSECAKKMLENENYFPEN